KCSKKSNKLDINQKIKNIINDSLNTKISVSLTQQIYLKKNKIYQICTSLNKNSLEFINLNTIINNTMFGKINCFYLHGMGYKCGAANNSLYFYTKEIL